MRTVYEYVGMHACMCARLCMYEYVYMNLFVLSTWSCIEMRTQDKMGTYR
jgi:hypothetical protein